MNAGGKQAWRPIAAAGAGFTLLAAILALLSPRAVDHSVEALLLDYRFRVRNLVNPPRIDPRIVIVAIDDPTLARYGRWPLPRSIQAAIIRKVLAAGPLALGIDIFYAEKQGEKEDLPLVRAVAAARNRVVLAAGFDPDAERTAATPEYLWDAAITRVRHAGDIVSPLTARGVRIGIDGLYNGARIGHVWSPADEDGRLRREHLFIRFDGDLYPSFALVTALTAMGKGPETITVHGGRGVEAAGIFIPTDPAGRIRINYPGPENTYPRISAADVLSPAFRPARLRGRIVLLGATALHTYDQAVTPLSARMPGVEKNAAVTDNIINRRFIREPPLAVLVAVILATGAVLTGLLATRGAAAGIGASLFLMAGVTAANLILFSFYDIYMNLFYPASSLAATSVFAVTWRFRHEEKRAREIRKMFASYVSPKIVDALVADPEQATLGGVRREVTVLFSDISGFTTLSEKNPPEEVVAMLNEYFSAMTEVIFRWDGTLDKFVGDEILAFWGAPLPQPDHAERAVRCAVEMSERLDRLREKWRREGRLVLDCGIGINSGEVLVGNIGAQGRKMDYTVIGDHVNLGARVEALTRSMGCRILITEFTLKEISPLVEEGRLGHLEIDAGEPVKVKGKDIPVLVHRMVPRPHRDGLSRRADAAGQTATETQS